MNPKEYQRSSSGKVIRTPKGYWAFIPNGLPPVLDWSAELAAALAEAERNLSRLNTIAGSLPFSRVHVSAFIRQEAVLSSRIEGTHATLSDVYLYEAGQLSFFEKSTDAREVANYVKALEFGLERVKTLPVSLRLIREVHACLMEGVRGGLLTPGEFRRSPNWIGPAGSTLETAVYVPPPVEEMQVCLDELEKFLHTEGQLPALVRAGLVHYQFEAIHPFLDGNGRIGRLLILLLLHEWGSLSYPLLNLSAFFESRRSEYYTRLLDVSRSGAWNEWLLFFLKGVGIQTGADAARLEKLTALHDQYVVGIRGGRRQDYLPRVLDLVFQRPILTIRQVEEMMKVPYMTAERCVERLVKAGVLREITGKMRNRIFRADAVMDVLQG
jgi:Fic family protein